MSLYWFKVKLYKSIPKEKCKLVRRYSTVNRKKKRIWGVLIKLFGLYISIYIWLVDIYIYGEFYIYMTRFVYIMNYIEWFYIYMKKSGRFKDMKYNGSYNKEFYKENFLCFTLLEYIYNVVELRIKWNETNCTWDIS